MNKDDPSLRFRTCFTHRHVVLPVVHVTGVDQAQRNAEIARKARADGVFLISHGSIGADELLEIQSVVKREFPDWWVGVNCLDLDPQSVMERIDNSVDGVWVDQAMIDEDEDNDQPAAASVIKIREGKRWSGLYFGGVAFKYQRHVEAVGKAARIARRYMDVVTTSGPGTGRAAEPDKIRTMKEALGDFLLAIASGITPENVTAYLPIADCFLVATGISRDFENLDPALTKTLVDTVRGVY